MSDRAPPRIDLQPLPYVQRLGERTHEDIDLVVIHCTELPDLTMAREYGERVLYASGSGNSGHFYIDRDGRIVQYVPLERIAHHVSGFNPRSIGIELVNSGRYPHWLDSRHQAMDEPYPDVQIAALIDLLQHLCETVPALQFIAGHEALDTRQVAASDDAQRQVPRKRDPGPQFPWPRVMAAVRLHTLVP